MAERERNERELRLHTSFLCSSSIIVFFSYILMTGSSLIAYTYSKLVNYFIAPYAVIIIPVKYVGKIKNFFPQYTNFCSTESPGHVDTNLSCPGQRVFLEICPVSCPEQGRTQDRAGSALPCGHLCFLPH